MKVKAMALIILVVFAFAAVSIAFGMASNQRSEREANPTQSYSIVRIGNKTIVEPNEEIDTPGAPGQRT